MGFGFNWESVKRVGEALATGGISEVNNFRKGTNVAGQPGVGGPAANPGALQQDPVTGAFFDPSTGTSYTDAGGTIPVADPNLAQQTAANFATRTAMLGKLAGSDKTLDQVSAQQGDLAGTLQQTLTDPNAPSVARTQLAQTTDANGRAILGTAAGVGGANGYDARRNAVNVLAGSNTAAAGNAALLRQKEVADATSGLSTLLNQRGSAAQSRYNTNASAGSDFSKQAGDDATNRARLDLDANTANQTKDEKYIGSGLKLISGAGGAPGGGGH